MPQNALGANVALNPSNQRRPLRVDASGNLLETPTNQAASFTTNITAAAVVKATPGRLARVTILAPGSGSGSFTLNNCATTGAASAANLIWTRLFSGVAAGDVFVLDVPCSVGIVVSAVPGAGSPILAVSYS